MPQPKKEMVGFRLTEIERMALEAVTWHHSGEDVTLSEFVRELVLEAVHDYLDEHGRQAVLRGYTEAKDQKAQARKEEELRLLEQAMQESSEGEPTGKRRGSLKGR